MKSSSLGAAGQKTRCSRCQAIFLIPAPEPEPTPPPTPPEPIPFEPPEPTPHIPASGFVYKMIQLPFVTVAEGIPITEQAAVYLEGIVNRWAAAGWEFYRIDSVGVRVVPGCLGSLFGMVPKDRLLHVVSFRRPAD